MKKESLTFLVILGAAYFGVIGCDSGTASAGASAAETKARFDKQPLENKAKTILASPLLPADKRKKIEQMYKDAGQEAPADLLQQADAAGPGGPGMPTPGMPKS
jgi:hypothetical protein